jgi:hypothetical protein
LLVLDSLLLLVCERGQLESVLSNHLVGWGIMVGLRIEDQRRVLSNAVSILYLEVDGWREH